MIIIKCRIYMIGECLSVFSSLFVCLCVCVCVCVRVGRMKEYFHKALLLQTVYCHKNLLLLSQGSMVIILPMY